MSIPQLSVIVPVFNNASTLEELYVRLSAIANELSISWELIVINDASHDDSLQVAEQLFHRHQEVTILDLYPNMGQNGAVLLGLTEAHAEWCVVMDADIQDPPEGIKVLWLNRINGYEAIFAGRRGTYESMFRLVTGRIYRLVMAQLTSMPKDAGMFVLMHRPLINLLLSMHITQPMLPAMIACAGMPMLSIPIERNVRPSGQSSYTFSKRLRSACSALRCMLEFRYASRPHGFLDRLVHNPIKRRYSHSA